MLLGPIDIATEVNVQLKTVMDFNQHLQAPERNIQIVKYKDMPQVKPPWLISVTIHTNHLPKTACSGKLLYTLVHGYGHWGMAGSTWGLYRLSSDLAPQGCSWLMTGP